MSFLLIFINAKLIQIIICLFVKLSYFKAKRLLIQRKLLFLCSPVGATGE